MAYELSAVIRLRDEFTKNMRRVRESTEDFNKSVDKVKKVGDSIGNVGKKLTMGVTLPLTGVATAALATVSSFDDSMSQVRALTGATGSEFDELRAKALEMGAKTRYSASESADAFSYMALAGWETTQMLAAIEPMLNLASAGGMDLAQTSDIVTEEYRSVA